MVLAAAAGMLGRAGTVELRPFLGSIRRLLVRSRLPWAPSLEPAGQYRGASARQRKSFFLWSSALSVR